MAKYDFQPALFISSVSPLENEKLYNAAYRIVSEERKKKTDRCRFEKDKRLSLGAGVLLSYAFSHLGISESFDDIVYGENEKPYFKNNGVYFNLSHSGDYAVCAVAQCEIGCDIEIIKPLNLNVAERFFSKNEYAHILKQTGDEEKADLFFRYWTLKESFMKATGLGMKLALDSFEIVLSDNISVKQTVSDKYFSFKEFGLIPGYKCAVCISDGIKDISVYEPDIASYIIGG